MKKATLIIFLLIASTKVKAQNMLLTPVVSFGSSTMSNAKSTFKFGERDEQLDFDATFKSSYTLGFECQYTFSDNWIFNIGMMYAKEGLKYRLQDQKTDIKNKYNVDYLRIPIYLSYSIGQKSNILRPFFLGGMSMALKVGQCQQFYSQNEYTRNLLNSIPIVMPSFDHWDLGIQVGAGGSYRINPSSSVVASIIFYQSLKDAFIDHKNMKNQFIRLQLGYQFTL